MKTQESAWNLPDLEGKISLGYKITEQLNVAADVFIIGTRKALVVDVLNYAGRYEFLNPLNSKSYKLDTVLDMNFSAGYKITSKISAFVQLNNLGFQKYEQWFGYTVQGFNFLGGISCSF
jgi:hypothetical protein